MYKALVVLVVALDVVAGSIQALTVPEEYAAAARYNRLRRRMMDRKDVALVRYVLLKGALSIVNQKWSNNSMRSSWMIKIDEKENDVSITSMIDDTAGGIESCRNDMGECRYY